ncbi:unnamed protein product [Mycena citricolor]|uniref:Uncharacterized protein n=1 Tax=Mycena citricolor TaxID=2018698 RepID=A0AAD2HZ05_9AGAR|nr:unnamed protein product [Mycena citricolor]
MSKSGTYPRIYLHRLPIQAVGTYRWGASSDARNGANKARCGSSTIHAEPQLQLY